MARYRQDRRRQVNHKLPDYPAEVRILLSDPSRRYNTSNFEQFVPAEEGPPQATSVTAANDLILRFDAELPARRMVETSSVSSKFVETWNRKRSDLADQSQSSYDLSLATIAAALAWTNQEIADLIIAARREHNEKPEKALRRDYIVRTLARARQAAAEMPKESADVDLSSIVGQTAASTGGGTRSVMPGVTTYGLRVDTVCLADVEPEPVHWLWPDRFALGKLSLIAGEPGLGKSFLTLDMAARVSRGTGWPCNETIGSEPAGVVLLSAEDDIKDTIAPRLIAAGADRSRILAMRAIYQPQLALVPGVEKQVPFSLLEHVPQLEELVRRAAPCRLVIVDPVSAFLGLLNGRRSFEQSALPPRAQLSGQVDAQVFCDLVDRDVLLGAAREQIARAVHDEYVLNQKANKPADDPAMQAWDKLPEHLKESNRKMADSIPEKLRRIGYGFRPTGQPAAEFLGFAPAELEALAELEHDRWVSERLQNGWSLGSRDVDRRISPYLVPWAELDDKIKAWDRHAVLVIPKVLARAGFEIYRLD
jgi:hypothetical protein